jgi:DNA-directed RNA polymerase sigma subunit (sigma70/sigma32)
MAHEAQVRDRRREKHTLEEWDNRMTRERIRQIEVAIKKLKRAGRSIYQKLSEKA